MSQPKEPPISVRVPKPLLAAVDALALKMNNCSRNAMIVRLIAKGLAGNEGIAAVYAAERAAELSELAKHAPPEIAAAAKAQSKDWRKGLAVTFGPIAASPGSRLKKGK